MRIKIGDSRLFFDVDGAKLRPDGPRMKEVPYLVGTVFPEATYDQRLRRLQSYRADLVSCGYDC